MGNNYPEMNAVDVLELLGNTTKEQQISFCQQVFDSLENKRINPEVVNKYCVNILSIITNIQGEPKFTEMLGKYLAEKSNFDNTNSQNDFL